jgi:membrane protein
MPPLQNRSVFHLAKTAAKGFGRDKALTFAAALAYYTILSMAPLLLIVLAVVGLVYGSEGARAGLLDKVGAAAGPSGSEVARMLLENASKPGQGMIAALVGLAAALMGATGLLVQVKAALNHVWDVRPPKSIVRGLIRARLVGALIVLAVAVGLVALVAASTLVSAMADWISRYQAVPPWVVGGIDLLVTLGAVAALFAAVFRYLPDARIDWREAWIGGSVTALLFAVGKVALGIYLAHSSIGSVYGAAGSLVLVLVWIYYSAAIFLFGAELTQAHAAMHGKPITPTPGAERKFEARPAVDQKPWHRWRRGLA